MFRNRLYYALKPFVPWSVRMGIRRWHAARTRKQVGGVWPIHPGSERPPEGWPGWPDGKKFAFVLTHDVEGPEGLAKVKPLAELEMSLGLRSSFNLIPKGPYTAPAELRAWLVQNGFEVGVHDLHHDGKLFSSRAAFPDKARCINSYLREWGVVGFRSGFMLRHLDWLHDLEIGYDATSFDTDPFEPQPEGVGTIFPFFVQSAGSSSEFLLSAFEGSALDKSSNSDLPSSGRSAPPLSDLRPLASGSSPQSSAALAKEDPLSVFEVSALEGSSSHFAPRTSHFSTAPRLGYVELPYTLPQDSTLFLVLREKGPEIWLRKLDWVAERGGMALLNVHPDYVRFPGEPPSPRTFPVEHYRALLEHVRTNYILPRAMPQAISPGSAPEVSALESPHCSQPTATTPLTSLNVERSMLNVGCSTQSSTSPVAPRTSNLHASPAPASVPPPSHFELRNSNFQADRGAACWPALPREVAAFVSAHRQQLKTPSSAAVHVLGRDAQPIWIDLENTPHIPFFKPIAKELERRGYRVVFTARDAYQTCEMADRYGLTYARIGRHYGKQKLAKVCGLFIRSHQLIPFVLREKPCLALNHGSRTQTYIANRFGIPTVTIMDYEHTAHAPLWRPLWEIVPSLMSTAVGHNRKRGGVHYYAGIKEDVYVPAFTPNPAILSELGLAGWRMVITVRPPATEAHYHNPEAEVLFEHVMKRIHDTPDAKAVLLPRSKTQEAEIRSKWPQWFADGGVVIPSNVVDGLNLLWHSDLVVSGGGTMNREAAAMGIPVYSIFRGTIGAVDKHLVSEGRLTLIESVDDVYSKIALEPRLKDTQASFKPRRALGDIVAHIESILNGNR